MSIPKLVEWYGAIPGVVYVNMKFRKVLQVNTKSPDCITGP